MRDRSPPDDVRRDRWRSGSTAHDDERTLDCVPNMTHVKRTNARGNTLHERFRLEHRQVVTTPSGERLVVVASPRSLVGDLLDRPLPWPILLRRVAIRQFVFVLRRQPGWQVEVTPAWEPNCARVVAKASKADAIRRVDREAAAARGTA